MNNSLALFALVLGVLFVLLAFVYWLIPAGSLPVHLPGYILGSSKVHYKHGIGALCLALALFAFSWFQSGKKST